MGGFLLQSKLRRLLQERNALNPRDKLMEAGALPDLIGGGEERVTSMPEVRGGRELPTDTSSETDEAALLELFKDPASLGRLQEHMMNAPKRENFQPGSMDRITAALSSALESRPHDRAGRIQTALDRPYDQAVEEYNLEGKGMAGLVQAEEGSLNRQRLGRQAVDSLRERKRSSQESAEIRRQQLEDRLAQNQAQLEDRDLDRQSKEELAKESNALRLEIAKLGRTTALAIQGMKGANEKPPKKIWAYHPDKNQNLYMDEDEVASQGYESKVGDLHIAKEKFHRTVEERALKAHEIIKRRPDLIGILQGPMTTTKAALGSDDPDVQTLTNLLAGLRAERLREEAGAALTPTELSVYDPVLPKLSGGFMGTGQSDEKMEEVLKQVALKARSQMRRRTHGSLPWERRKKKLRSGIEVTIEDE